MFTKWIVLRLAETFLQHQQIPIYIELRDIRDKDSHIPFERLVFEHITTTRTIATFNQFVEGIKAGLFLFVLDAADEIRKTDRPSVCKKIEEFRHTFPECGILLTSRDFNEIEGINGFETYSTRSLRKSEAVEILRKLDYDDEVREALIALINSDKTERHIFFLSNPLLVTILLLTYDQSKEIPTKRSSIYKRAFEALYERHDTSKGIYRRDHHAGLPMDEFEAVFSTFCFGTYVNGKIDFDESELVPLFKAACEMSGIDESPDDIAKDAYESACLLTKEGHDFVFCHRSFQEYFVAVYLRDDRGDDLPRMLELALKRGQGENVIEFLFEIDKKDLERYFVLPSLQRTIRRIERRLTNTSDDGRVIAQHFFKYIKMRGEDRRFAGIEFNESDDANFIFSITSIYPELNLLFTMVKLEKEGIRYHDVPVSAALKTASASSKYNTSWKQDVITLRFSATASEWFGNSGFQPRMLKLWSDMQNLRDRLVREYESDSTRASKKFERFA